MRWLLPLLLVGGLALGCGESSSPGSQPPPLTPSAPSFVVVSTDWVCAQMGVGSRPDGSQYSYCATYNAHGVFRNTGPAASAAVQFSVYGQVMCTAAIQETPTNGVSEALCQAPRGQVSQATPPPDAKIT